jgi:hypothetical protein
MFKWYLPFILSFLAGTAIADSAAMWVFPDGRGAMPIENDQITMEAESVSIVPTGNMLNHYVPEMTVTCVFYLRNLTDQTLDVSVGFPFESFYGMSNYGERSNWYYDRALEEMSGKEAGDVPADSMMREWFMFRAFTDSVECEVTYERGNVNRDNKFIFWPLIACWNMHFQPRQTVRLVNTYNTGWNYYGYSGNFTASLTYIVRSGALWAGRIGDAVISITVPEQYYSMFSDSVCTWTDWNGSPEVDGNRVTWHFTDWKPVEDITITSSGHHYVDGAVLEYTLYEIDCYSFDETELYSRWTPDEIYPAALDVFQGANPLPAEAVARVLENTVYGMSGMLTEQPHRYLNMALGVYGDLPFDQEKLEIVMGLQQYLAECRINMESAGFDFLLPMAARRRNWYDVNWEMYCADPRNQALYLLLLENIEDAVMGRPIIDPALESLFWLTGWFLPEKVSLGIYAFRNYYSCYYWDTDTSESRDTTIITREEVRNFWMDGGGCNLPLVLSSCSEDCDIAHMIGLSIEASSELSGQAGNNYSADNLTDGDHETAWVEGIYGYGHGEVITVSVIDKIIAEGFAVRNGYCRPDGAWLENARIRKFIVCLNDSPFMVVELEDTMDMQVIRFSENLSLGKDDSLTFEILEIYPGSMYQDAAVSELSLIIEQ